MKGASLAIEEVYILIEPVSEPDTARSQQTCAIICAQKAEQSHSYQNETTRRLEPQELDRSGEKVDGLSALRELGVHESGVAQLSAD